MSWNWMSSALPSARISAARLAPFSISRLLAEARLPLTMVRCGWLVVSVWNDRSVSRSAVRATPQDRTLGLVGRHVHGAVVARERDRAAPGRVEVGTSRPVVPGRGAGRRRCLGSGVPKLGQAGGAGAGAVDTPIPPVA